MNELTQFAADVRQGLEGIHPQAPWFLLAGLVWLAVFCVRRYYPAAWETLESWGPQGKPAALAFQALPAVIMGAAVAALSAGQDPWVAVYGAVSGAVAPLVHHLLKAIPWLPYTGKTGQDGPGGAQR